MSDTGNKRYDIKESANRIFRALIGSRVPTDVPNTIPGEVFSIDEAISKLAELIENNLAGYSLTLPTLKIGDSENYIEFEDDGTLLLTGDATVYDDIRFPALALRAPASGAAAEPDLVQFKDNGTGSTGVFSFAFDPDTEEEMYFAVQMPHSWAGTPIEPHIHWSVMTNCTGTVGWAIEYTFSEITGTFSNTIFTTYTGVNPQENNLIAYRHYLSDFPAITGSFGSGTLSAMMIGRIFRDATSSLVADSCPEDAVLLELDFHFEIDRLGSREEYVR